MQRFYRNFTLSPQSTSGLGTKSVFKQCQRKSCTWERLMNLCTDQGEMFTVLSFINAVGCVWPPLVIHKGQQVQANWSDSIPHFIKLAVTSKGYITKHQFHQYAIHFVQYLVKIGHLDHPHLLIIDSHEIHVHNLHTCYDHTTSYKPYPSTP